MDLAEMITLVRQELHDEDAGNCRWTDSELARHIRHALNDFSGACPLEEKAVLATASGSREISLASLAGPVMVEAVEYPLGRYPAAYQRFSLWGDTLTLRGDTVPDGADCRVYYGKLHTLDESTSTLPARYTDLVAAGAAGYAAFERAAYSINRSNTGGNSVPADFLAWGREKLASFREELKRAGRRNRARVRALYRPSHPAVSRATDYGP